MSRELARAREFLFAGKLRACAGIRPDRTVGSLCSAKTLGVLHHAGTSYTVYGYQYEGTEVAAVTDAPVGNATFSVAINSRFPWAHRVDGFDQARVYLLPDEPLVQGSLEDLDRACAGTWSEIDCNLPIDATAWMSRIDDDRALLVCRDQAAVVSRERRALTRLAEGPWRAALAIVPDRNAVADPEGVGYTVVSVGAKHVSVYDSGVDRWQSLGTPPIKKARVDVLVPIDNGRVLALFYRFGGGSDGGFDWDQEDVFPWIFDSRSSQWSECPTEGTSAWKQRDRWYTRMPVRAAITLADGRVLSCEGGRRYVFDPLDVDEGVEAGPRLDDEESLVPRLWAQPNGDALIVTEASSNRDSGRSRRSHALLWCARSHFLYEVGDFGGWIDGTVVRVGPDLYARVGGVELQDALFRPGQSVRARGLEFVVVKDDGGAFVAVKREGRKTRLPRAALPTQSKELPVLQLRFFCPERGGQERIGPPPPMAFKDPSALGLCEGVFLVGATSRLFLFEAAGSFR